MIYEERVMLIRKKKALTALFLCLTMIVQLSSFCVLAEEQEEAETIEIIVTEDDVVSVEESETVDTIEEKKNIINEETEAVEATTMLPEEQREEEKETYEEVYQLDVLPDSTLFENSSSDTATDVQPMSITEKSVNRRHRVAVGDGHSIFLKDDGTVVTWGVYYDESHPDGVGNIKTPTSVKDLSYIVSVTAADYWGYALDIDGMVWEWGPELEAAPKTESFTAQKVEGLSDIVEISSEGSYNLALKADGTVWQWGEYEGLETIETPELVRDQDGNALTGIVEIDAGEEHGLALSADGKLYSWGDNFYGQLGDGTREKRSYADLVRSVEESVSVTDIEAGDGYNVVTTQEGEELAWGKSDQIHGKQFETHLWSAASLDSADTVESVVALSSDMPPGNVVDMATSSMFQNLKLAFCEDGSVWRTGECKLTITESGILELDLTVQTTDWIEMEELASLPQKPYDASDEIISASAFNEAHSMAVVDGVLMAAGSNKYGQLGDGTFVSSNEPVPVINYLNEPMDDVKKVSVGNGYALILNNDGRVWSVGFNEYGKLGDGTSENQNKVYPVRGKNGNGFLRDFVDVAAGYRHSLAVKSDGSVWAWGSNSAGQLGDGTHTTSIVPVRVKGANGEDWIKNAVSAYANANCSMVLNEDGTVYMWGNNDKGQLGNGNKTNQSIPVQVKGQNGVGVLDGIVQIATAEGCSIALDEDGTVWTWGGNQNGRLGDGTTTDRYYPDKVQKADRGGGVLDDIVAISAGYYFNAALDSKGFVWMWGKNDKGQLGNGTTTDQYKAVQVLDLNVVSGYLSGVRSISCGREYTLATAADGSKLVWGYNRYGQYGAGTVGYTSTTPVSAFLVSSLTKDVMWLNQRMNSYQNVSGNISLPTVGLSGSQITWSSGRPDLLDNNGRLISTPVFDTDVVLTATLRGTNNTVRQMEYTVNVKANIQGFSEEYTQSFTGTASSEGNAGSTQISALPMWQFTYPGITNGADGQIHTGQVLGKDSYLTLKKLSSKNVNDENECVVASRTLAENSDTSLKSAHIGFTAKAYTTGNIHFAPVNVNGDSVCQISLLGSEKKIIIQYGQENNGTVTAGTKEITDYDPTTEHNYEIYAEDNGALSVIIDGTVVADGKWLPNAGQMPMMTQWKVWITNAADTGDAGSIKKFVVDKAAEVAQTTGEFTLQTTSGKSYLLQLVGKDIKTFAQKTLTVLYDDQKLEAVDLIGGSFEKELTAGSVYDGVQILTYTPGKIQLKLDRTIPEDFSYDGLMNTIAFRAKTDGETMVTVKMEGME